jgi:ethanolamine utilization protein EutQ (cupin superfamily)
LTKGREDKMPAILRKSDDIKWEKVGAFFDMDDSALPGVKALKEAEVSMLFDSSQCKHFGSVFEKWPPVAFDWHQESDEIFYIISGGPMKVTCEGEVMEGTAGDVFLFTRGTDLSFDIKNQVVGISFYYPTFEEILKRYKEYAKKSKK